MNARFLVDSNREIEALVEHRVEAVVVDERALGVTVGRNTLNLHYHVRIDDVGHGCRICRLR